MTLPDTPANQAAYPQPASQLPGLGFSQSHIVGLICLASGAILDATIGAVLGKGSDEQSLLRSLLETLQTGDLFSVM